MENNTESNQNQKTLTLTSKLTPNYLKSLESFINTKFETMFHHLLLR